MTPEPRPTGVCGRPLPTDRDALLYPAEAAFLMALSARTLEGMRIRGGGPAFVRLTRAVRYRRSDVIAWIEERRFYSTSEADNARR
jgi:predicted DNA-binding transcriptional regulator AlpA